MQFIEQIGDIEGQTARLREELLQLVTDQRLILSAPLESDNPADWIGRVQLAPETYLVLAGDIGDPMGGPFASETYAFINELRRRHPQQMFTLLGNRDINKLRLLYEMVADFSNVRSHERYPDWSPAHDCEPSDPAIRLRFILEKTMGAGKAYENHRRAIRERLARACGLNTEVTDALIPAAVLLDQMTLEELREFYPRIYTEAAATGLPLSVIHPYPGALREYMLGAQIIAHFQLPDVEVVFTHGSVSATNVGKVPFGLEENEAVEAGSLAEWTSQLNQMKEEALNCSKTPTDSSQLLIEYASYSRPIMKNSIVATKSGASDSMIKRDSRLIEKARKLSGGRPVIFASGHTPGRNAWQSDDDGPRIIRLTNDPTFDGIPSRLVIANRAGVTSVCFSAQLKLENERCLVEIIDETPASPSDRLSAVGHRIEIEGVVYVVIGQLAGSSDWIVEHSSPHNGFRPQRKLLSESELRNLL